ncbi:MAG: hypothetical protein ACXVCP_15915 [Bdellovibrio sp.]
MKKLLLKSTLAFSFVLSYCSLSFANFDNHRYSCERDLQEDFIKGRFCVDSINRYYDNISSLNVGGWGYHFYGEIGSNDPEVIKSEEFQNLKKDKCYVAFSGSSTLHDYMPANFTSFIAEMTILPFLAKGLYIIKNKIQPNQRAWAISDMAEAINYSCNKNKVKQELVNMVMDKLRNEPDRIDKTVAKYFIEMAKP